MSYGSQADADELFQWEQGEIAAGRWDMHDPDWDSDNDEWDWDYPEEPKDYARQEALDYMGKENSFLYWRWYMNGVYTRLACLWRVDKVDMHYIRLAKNFIKQAIAREIPIPHPYVLAEILE